MKKILPITLIVIVAIVLVIVFVGTNDQTKGENTLGDIEVGTTDGIGAETDENNSSTERRRVEVLKSNKQGDPDANRYDFASNDMDQNCDGDTDLSENCGDGTNPVEGDCVPGAADCEALDDDDDGDSVPIEDDASASAVNNPMYTDNSMQGESPLAESE